MQHPTDLERRMLGDVWTRGGHTVTAKYLEEVTKETLSSTGLVLYFLISRPCDVDYFEIYIIIVEEGTKKSKTHHFDLCVFLNNLEKYDTSIQIAQLIMEIWKFRSE